MILLALLSAPLPAADIYLLESEDGTISFTDVPAHSGYTLFLPDDPPPDVSQINLHSFPQLDDFDALFLRAERRYGVRAELLKAICVAESGMRPEVVSQAGAVGLMQLMPATARSLAVADPRDPAQAIDGGARYMARLLRQLGDLPRAVAAYNAGPAAVERYNGIPPFPETLDYVPKVLDIYEYFRSERPLDRNALE